jgi:transketolase
MGMSDFFTVLFSDFLNYDPANPEWINRDRLILSNGHASTILYSALYLAGYRDISLEDLKSYRELGSLTAGHPEYGHFMGIEATTGPLGQGIAMAVGMTMAERLLNRDHPIIDHNIYVVVGDGCLMEGISYEAAAFAGQQGLSKLIVLYDDNGITIEGGTSQVTLEDHCRSFEAMGWNTFKADGHDFGSIKTALASAKAGDRPAFISMKTIIGFGSPGKQGRAVVHGAPLGREEYEATAANLSWTQSPFETPESGLKLWRRFAENREPRRKSWYADFERLEPAEREELGRRRRGELSPEARAALDATKREFSLHPKPVATRTVTALLMDRIMPAMPELVSGSCDLGESNGSRSPSMKDIFRENGYAGNYIHYGIREHFMAAALNGMAIYGSLKVFGSTYFVFSDYMRPAIRLAALMQVPSIFLFSHDSIGVGPDGPTHQPVEQLPSLRMIPHLRVYRPADAVEAVECWDLVLSERHRPSVLVMSRQNAHPVRMDYREENLSARGGYFVRRSPGECVRFLSSGTEVHACLEAADLLEKSGVAVSVVSVPCLDRLLEQDESYRRELFGADGKAMTVAVEAAGDTGWARWLGQGSHFIGMDEFGRSGPGDALYRKFGLDSASIAAKVLGFLGR